MKTRRFIPVAAFLAVAALGQPVHAQVCRQFTISVMPGDGSTPLPTDGVQILLNAPCPGCNVGSFLIPGSLSFYGHSGPNEVIVSFSTNYFGVPAQPIGTCTLDEALGCHHCDGQVSAPVYAIRGNIDGNVTDCTSGQGVQGTVVLGLGGNPGGQKVTDAAGYFNFKAPPAQSGSNEWGVVVQDTGNGTSPGSANYVVDVVGVSNGGVSLGPVDANVHSSELVTVELFVKKTTVKEPGRCKPRVVRRGGGGPTPVEPSPNVGAPVNVITGNVWFDRSDASVVVDGSALSLIRSYNSANRDVVGVLGRGWTHSFERRMNITNPQTAQRVIEFVDSDGTRIYYQDGDEDQKYVAQYPRSHQHWITASGGNYIREFEGGGSETYDSAGNLIQETDPQGRTKTYTYSGSQLISVSSSGRTLTLGYTNYFGNNRLSSVTGPAGELLVTYGYGPASANTFDALQRVDYPDGTGYLFQYQGSGNTLLLTGVTDLEGKWIERHTYDASSRGITSEIADGIEGYTIAYGASSTTVTDALNRATVYDFELIGAEKRVTRITGPCAGCGGGGSDVQEWTYDSQGRVLTYTDAEGGTTSYTYAAADNDDVVSVQFGKPTAAPSYTEPPMTYEYTNGFLSKVTGVDGSTTEYERNAVGDVTRIKDPLLRETTLSYADGRVATITDPRLKTTTMGYDPTTGDLLTVTDPLTHATTFAYNSRGQRTTVTDALNHTTTTTYDGAGKVTRVTNDDGTYTEFLYDRGGRRSEVIDPLKRSTRYLYDLYGRLTTVIDPAGGATRYAYDVMGNLTGLTDARNQATSFEYNSHNQVTKTIYPGGAFETFTYDTLSRLVTMTDRKGVVTTYAYDPKSRLTGKTFSDGTPAFSYTYDLGGRMLTAQNGSDTLTWGYNLAGELLTEQSAANSSTVAYTYDDGGNRLSVSLDGTLFVSYAYDDASRLTSITRGTNVFGFAYDAANRRTSMTYPNGVDTAYTYDALNRLTNLAATHTATSTPITNFGYVYDAAGNRTQKSTLDYTEDYGYDPLHRLTRADRTNPGPTPPNQWTWSYDAVGNRTSAQKDQEATTSTHNEKNQLLSTTGGGKMLWRGVLDEPGIATFSAASASINGQPARMLAGNVFEATLDLPAGPNTVTIQAQDGSGNTASQSYSVNVTGGGATYTYDANGNLATKTEGADAWVYTWNALNQLTAVTKNAMNEATYSYDPAGRRVERASVATTHWTYDGQDILKQTEGTTTTEFVQGSSVDEPLSADDGTAITYLHADVLSSVVRHTTSTGAVAQTIKYDPWGNIQVGSPSPYGFTGREWDPSIALYYYRARYFETSSGRFLSQDPIGFSGGLNLYAYVGNRPTLVTDPLGLQDPFAGNQACPCSAIPGHCCEGKARVLRGNKKHVGQTGGMPPLVITADSGAVAPEQFGRKSGAQMRKYGDHMSGWVTTGGSLGPMPLFNCAREVIGPEDDRNLLLKANPNKFIVELPGMPEGGAKDYGTITIQIRLPDGLNCPSGMSPIPCPAGK